MSFLTLNLEDELETFYTTFANKHFIKYLERVKATKSYQVLEPKQPWLLMRKHKIKEYEVARFNIFWEYFSPMDLFFVFYKML